MNRGKWYLFLAFLCSDLFVVSMYTIWGEAGSAMPEPTRTLVAMGCAVALNLALAHFLGRYFRTLKRDGA
jgi:hypothetical protein